MPDFTRAAVTAGPGGGRVLFEQDLSGYFVTGGLDAARLEAAVRRAEDVRARLAALAGDGGLERLAGCDPGVAAGEARAAYERLAAGARTIVFLGAGDESRAAQMLARFGGWSIPGVAALNGHEGPMTRFYDTLDPFTLLSALGRLDLARTRFVVLSRTGRGEATLVQVLAAIEAVRAAGLAGRVADLFLSVTGTGEGAENGLARLLANFGVERLDYGAGMPGQFAVFHNAGLVAAVARGADPARLIAGARAVVGRFAAGEDGVDFAPLVGAIARVELVRQGAAEGEMFVAGADRLGMVGDWLGSRRDGGRAAVTLASVEMAGAGPRIAEDLAALAGVEVLGGLAAGDLAMARSNALAEAFRRAGRPVRRLHIPSLDEEAMGALVMHLMLEAILTGWLTGTDAIAEAAL